MSRVTERLERDLREIGAGAQPAPSGWESILAKLHDEAEPVDGFGDAPAPHGSKRPVWLAVAAAAVVAVIASVAVLTRAGDDQSISVVGPGETVIDIPKLTTTFVSPTNAFSIKYPDGGTVTPATEGDFDVVETGVATAFKGRSEAFDDEVVLADGITPVQPDEQIDQRLSEAGGGCGVPRRQQPEITIDGRSGRISECPNRIDATVVADGRLYTFTLSHDRRDARAVFDAFVATIELIPDTPFPFPAMTSTFVSPTYGYSFKYLGALEAATERWDPTNHPVADRYYDGRFDGVETGQGAYFAAASTELPPGVSVDAWVDEFITPVAAGGCGVARNKQRTITIDGQPGTIAGCDGWTEATVVAGGRLYLFAGPGPGNLPTNMARRNTAWFDAWIATIALTPETAVAPRSTTGSSDLDTSGLQR